MKSPRILLLLALAAGLAPPVGAASPNPAPVLLGVAGRPALPTPPLALIAKENVTLRLYAHGVVPDDKGSAPRLFQLAHALARPVETSIHLAPDPAAPRELLVRFTVPEVQRATRFALHFGERPPLTFVVLPATPRRDLASLAETLEATRTRLMVCGPSRELRAWLHAEKLEFSDAGNDPPASVPADTILLGAMDDEDWQRLTASRTDTPGRILAFVDSPSLLPGVYAAPSARHAKITLPLLAALPADPLSRETLHALLLRALSSSTLEP